MNPPLLDALTNHLKNRLDKTPGQTNTDLKRVSTPRLSEEANHHLSSICPNSRANFQQAIPRKAESQRSGRSMRTAERGEQRAKKHRKSGKSQSRSGAQRKQDCGAPEQNAPNAAEAKRASHVMSVVETLCKKTRGHAAHVRRINAQLAARTS